MATGGLGLVRLTSENAKRGMVVVQATRPSGSPLCFLYSVCIGFGHGKEVILQGVGKSVAYTALCFGDLPYHIVPPWSGDQKLPVIVPVLESNAVVGAPVFLLESPVVYPSIIGELLAVKGPFAVVRWSISDPTLEIHRISMERHSGLFYGPSLQVLEMTAESLRIADLWTLLDHRRKPNLGRGSVEPHQYHLFRGLLEIYTPSNGVLGIGPCLSKALSAVEPPVPTPVIRPALPAQPTRRPLPVQPEVPPIPAEPERLPAPVPTEDDEIACVICRANVRDRACNPCMHTVYCSGCLKFAKDKDGRFKTCPICRREVRDIVRIFR